MTVGSRTEIYSLVVGLCVAEQNNKSDSGPMCSIREAFSLLMLVGGSTVVYNLAVGLVVNRTEV